MSDANSFDALTDVYESMIDWPKRLSAESPFFRQLFSQSKLPVHRLLDSACGTGHHAALFSSWGLSVEAADLSPAMISRARSLHPESPTLHYALRSFTDPLPPESFDAALCIGNSLSLAPDHDTVARAVANLLSSLRPGGLLVLHVLNLWRLPDGPPVWQKCLRTSLPNRGDSLILKGVHRSGPRGFVNLLVSSLSTSLPTLQSDCVPFLGLQAPDLASLAHSSGARSTQLFGSHSFSPYTPTQSPDLLLVATK